MCTVHCTLYTVQCTMYTVNYTLYSPLCKITPTPCPRGNPSCKDTLPNYIAAGGHERSLENPQLRQYNSPHEGRLQSWNTSFNIPVVARAVLKTPLSLTLSYLPWKPLLFHVPRILLFTVFFTACNDV